MKSKKILTLLLAGTLCLGLLAGCGGKSGDSGSAAPAAAPTASADPDVKRFDSCGIQMTVPQSLESSGLLVTSSAWYADDAYETTYPYLDIVMQYSPITGHDEDTIKQCITDGDTESEEFANAFMEYITYSPSLASIFLVPEGTFDDSLSQHMISANVYQEVAKGPEKLATNDGWDYYYVEYVCDGSGMVDEAKSWLETCKGYLPTAMESISYYSVTLKPTDTDLSGDIVFDTHDLDGNRVTNAVFSQAEVTLVHVWGTFCSPCIAELPEVAQWVKTLPDNVQFIGVLSDVPLDQEGSGSEYQDAKLITEKAGVEFPNLLADEGLERMLEGIIATPTTFLVDSTGTVIGEPVVGAVLDSYKALVADYIH